MSIASVLLGAEKAEVTDLLIAFARQTDEEQRRQDRTPFFFPVTVSFADEKARCFSAFTRDISRSGLSLLHFMEIAPGEVTLTFRLKGNNTMRLPIAIRWCRPCGEGWYISGGHFAQVDDDEVKSYDVG